ncbi:hypothetical protein RJT34_32705 [Clitoria ternatea]|uniref:Transmembrane protein n=1 Tax=Clitoria ternatea TaxID=43366 RepID=A0AAN9I4U6_CLITE
MLSWRKCKSVRLLKSLFLSFVVDDENLDEYTLQLFGYTDIVTCYYSISFEFNHLRGNRDRRVQGKPVALVGARIGLVKPSITSYLRFVFASVVMFLCCSSIVFLLRKVAHMNCPPTTYDLIKRMKRNKVDGWMTKRQKLRLRNDNGWVPLSLSLSPQKS